MLTQKIKYLLILFFSLYELFASFISANITETLVNSLFEVKNFNPFFLLLILLLLPYLVQTLSEEKSRHKICSVDKNTFYRRIFLLGYLETLIELKNISLLP